MHCSSTLISYTGRHEIVVLNVAIVVYDICDIHLITYAGSLD